MDLEPIHLDQVQQNQLERMVEAIRTGKDILQIEVVPARSENNEGYSIAIRIFWWKFEQYTSGIWDVVSINTNLETATIRAQIMARYLLNNCEVPRN